MIRSLFAEAGNETNITAFFSSLHYTDIFAGKLKVLYDSYGANSRFCTFLEQDSGLIFSRLDRDFVLYAKPDNTFSQSPDNAEELAMYLKAERARTVFMPAFVMNGLEPYIQGKYLYNHLMQYQGEYIPAELDNHPRLDDVFLLLKDDFVIAHDTWLPDVSHRVRHGISEVLVYQGLSTVTVLYDRENTVFLTQVATKKEARGKGIATAMLHAVAGQHDSAGKTVYLICRDEMLGFYQRTGFVKVGAAAQIYRLDTDG